jgi:hypothetical protein
MINCVLLGVEGIIGLLRGCILVRLGFERQVLIEIEKGAEIVEADIFQGSG